MTSSVSVPTSIGGPLVTDPVAIQARVGLAFDADDLPVISFTGNSRRVYIAYDPIFPRGAVKDEIRVTPSGETVVDDSFVTGPVRFVKEGVGMLIRDGAATNSYGTLVAEGTLVVRNPTAIATGPLEIAGGAAVILEPPADSRLPSLTVDRLALEAAGRLDIDSGRFKVAADGITEEQLRAAIRSGRGNGDWGGTSGITSAAAVAAPPGTRAIGYAVGEDQSITVAFAAPGDTNLDGLVDVFDLVNVSTAGRYGAASSAGWSDGDFNYDGSANVFDLLALRAAGAFGSGDYLPTVQGSSSLVGEPVAVPEPTFGVLLATVAGGLLFSCSSRARVKDLVAR